MVWNSLGFTTCVNIDFRTVQRLLVVIECLNANFAILEIAVAYMSFVNIDFRIYVLLILVVFVNSICKIVDMLLVSSP